MEMLVVAVVAISAFAAVLLPLLRRGDGLADDREFDAVAHQYAEPTKGAARADAQQTAAPHGERNREDVPPDAAAERIEREVLRYRAALRAGTLCGRCGAANPPGSAYCADCGKRLPRADAREFA